MPANSIEGINRTNLHDLVFVFINVFRRWSGTAVRFMFKRAKKKKCKCLDC